MLLRSSKDTDAQRAEGMEQSADWKEHWAESGFQVSGFRCQETDVRGQRTEARGQTAEDRKVKLEPEMRK